MGTSFYSIVIEAERLDGSVWRYDGNFLDHHGQSDFDAEIPPF